MKNHNFIQGAYRSFFMNVVGFVCSIVLLSPIVSTAQTTFYRVYRPAAAATRIEASCIINSSVITGNRFLSVGKHNVTAGTNVQKSGLGLWTGTGSPSGAWKAANRYDRLGYSDHSDYSLNYINQLTVSGAYWGPYPYSGYVAVGARHYVVGNPGIEHTQTWTTIIDPTTRNAVWDHNIVFGNDDEDGSSEGVSAVRDEYSTSDFFVLSKVADFNATDNNTNRVGITRYTSVAGTTDHQVDWILQYAYPEYQLYPVSIVQNYYGDVTVIGNMVPDAGGPSCVFSFTADRATGAVISPLYHFSGGGYYDYDDLWANSATNHNGPYDQIVIAGRATPTGESYTLPMVMTLYPTGALYGCGVYRYKNVSTDNDYLTGQFNNAKMFNQRDAVDNNTVSRLVAVGDIGEQSTYPTQSSAIMMNAPNEFSSHSWTKTQGANLVNSGYTSATSAKWFVAQPLESIPSNPLKGEYVYIGTQINNGAPTINNIASGAFNKLTGFSAECTNEPFFVSNEQIFNEEELEIEATEWTTDEELRTETNSVTHDPFYCTGTSTANYGKTGENVQQEDPNNQVNRNEQADINVRNNTIMVNYTNTQENTVSVTVNDVLGNILIQKSIQCPVGNLSFTLSAKELTTGTYFVSVISPTSRFNKSIVIIK
jgi:hypothetical protein